MNPALTWTVQTIVNLSQSGYTGKIELNFFQGGVTGVNFSQSIKPLQEVRSIHIGSADVTLN